jgi:hypothetical protein
LGYIEPAAEALPNDPFVQYHLGAVYAALGRIPEALAQFTRVEEIGAPDSLAETVRSEIDRLSAADDTQKDTETTENN